MILIFINAFFNLFTLNLCNGQESFISIDRSDQNLLTSPRIQPSLQWSQSVLSLDDKPFNIKLNFINWNYNIPIEGNAQKLAKAQIIAFQKNIQKLNTNIFFLCKNESPDYNYACCIISINFLNNKQIYDCQTDPESNVCLISVEVRSKLISDLDLISANYSTIVSNDTCNFEHYKATPTLETLPPIFIKQKRPNFHKINLGKDIFLEYTNNELVVGDDFSVTISILETSPLKDFKLNCEIPELTFIEFRNVTPIHCQTRIYNESLTKNCSPTQQWHVQMSMPHRNSHLEFLARRIQTNSNLLAEKKRFGIFKIGFRIMHADHEKKSDTIPSSKDGRRMLPRILWSLGNENVPNVTRFNVKSSKTKHILIHVDKKLFIRYGKLMGPANSGEKLIITVYGLSKNNEIINVTEQATCYSSNTDIIRFNNDHCLEAVIKDEEVKSRIEVVQIFSKHNGLSTSCLVTFALHHEDSIALRLMNDPKYYLKSADTTYSVGALFKTETGLKVYPPVILQSFLEHLVVKTDGEREYLQIDFQKFINENLEYRRVNDDLGWTNINDSIRTEKADFRVLMTDHSRLIILSHKEMEIEFRLKTLQTVLMRIVFYDQASATETYYISARIINSIRINMIKRQEKVLLDDAVISGKSSLDRNSSNNMIYSRLNVDMCSSLKSEQISIVYSQSDKRSRMTQLNNVCHTLNSYFGHQYLDVNLTESNSNEYYLYLKLHSDSESFEISLREVIELFKKFGVQNMFKIEITNFMPNHISISIPEAEADWFIVREATEHQAPSRRFLRFRRSSRFEILDNRAISRNISMPTISTRNMNSFITSKLLEVSLIATHRDTTRLNDRSMSTLLFANIISSNQPKNQPYEKNYQFPGLNMSMNEDAKTGPNDKVAPVLGDVKKVPNPSVNTDNLDSAIAPIKTIPPLELGMYVLLGFVVLVALVFSVNCGAIVAKYRWNKIQLERNALANNQQTFTNTSISPVEAKEVRERANSAVMKTPKTSNGLMKDKNFVWIKNSEYNSRESIMANQKQAMGRMDIIDTISHDDLNSDDEINFEIRVPSQRPPQPKVMSTSMMPTYSDPLAVVQLHQQSHYPSLQQKNENYFQGSCGDNGRICCTECDCTMAPALPQTLAQCCSCACGPENPYQLYQPSDDVACHQYYSPNLVNCGRKISLNTAPYGTLQVGGQTRRKSFTEQQSLRKIPRKQFPSSDLKNGTGLRGEAGLPTWGHPFNQNYAPEEIRSYLNNLKESNA